MSYSRELPTRGAEIVAMLVALVCWLPALLMLAGVIKP